MSSKQNKKTLEHELKEYLKILENNPEERKAMNKALDRETKKLAKNKDTEFAAMFLSAIRF